MTLAEIAERFDDAVNALERIAQSLEYLVQLYADVENMERPA